MHFKKSTHQEMNKNDVKVLSSTGMKADAMATIAGRDHASSSIVLFDVGGKIFKVSRSTLDLYPDTMLARMASKEWKTTGENTPLFIDRDGDLFRYVLILMRDGGEVNLPMTESREGYLKELEFYGFCLDDFDERDVHVGTVAEAGKVMAALAGNVHKELDDMDDSIAVIEKQLKQLELRKEALKLAHGLFERSHGVQSKENCKKLTVRSKDKDDTLFARHLEAIEGNKAILNEYLERYGLKLVGLKFFPHAFDVAFCDFQLERIASRDKDAQSKEKKRSKKQMGGDE
ncbi:POZ domain-containing protein KCTD6 [Seminavis robusta]|uniref:POZ domain-containing protein KCTD6 n=1 Tax=Seminavis robusta TaxID=568900 RepID=A0A9N8E1G1_9STRA|nr:POZ domain-containing protein KCTD6 [Seminavis robusta]|eukprot:Sro553_g165260.1 POZ domain-containing protein KCTD6 (288) ;mRNA; f:14315-15178